MGYLPLSTVFLLLALSISYFCFLHVARNPSLAINAREALEIIRVGSKNYSPTPFSEHGDSSLPTPSARPNGSPLLQSPMSSPQPPPLPQAPLLPPSSLPSPPLLPPRPSPSRSSCPSPSPSIALVPAPAPASAPAPAPHSFFPNKGLKVAYKAIQKFKNTIDYDPKGITKSWVGKDVCKYKGFHCLDAPVSNMPVLAGVNFNGFNFNGKDLTLGGLVDDLKYLVFCHVNSNNITGAISPTIAQRPYFYELDLSNNNLTGKFPAAVLHATKLTFLDLRFNSLTGKLPHRVFTLDLDVLFLNNNKFLGKLPKNLGSTPALYLTLANNRFTGSIPKSIGQASNTLVEVLFLNNRLSGCLPYQIGQLKILTVFDASINRLTGPIPLSFGCLGKMRQLNLSYNQFFGEVPEMVCKLRNLYKMSLKNNYFTQVGSECMKLIKRKILDVSMNCILGLPSQRSAHDCAAFFSKRRACPGELRSYYYVPCGTAYPSISEETFEFDEPPAPAPSPSYAALERHRS